MYSLMTSYTPNVQSLTPLTNQYYSNQSQDLMSNWLGTNSQGQVFTGNGEASIPTAMGQAEAASGGNDISTLMGEWAKGAQGAMNAINAANGAFGLYSSIANFKTQKALNKENLKNAKLTNESLRFEIDNRKAEVARWNQIRSNVNKQMQSSSGIKTSY